MVNTCMYTVCTWYIPGQSIHIPVVPTGFSGQHRDGVQSDLPLPSSAREDEDEGSPCPEDGDFFNIVYTCLYNVHTCTVQCTYMYIHVYTMYIHCINMYVHVYQFNMLCLAGQHTFFNWLCTP